MKKTIIAMCVILVLMISVGLVVASAKNQKQKFTLPEHTVEVAPGLFYLGKALDKGKVVEGYAFMVKNKKKFARALCGDGKCHPVFEDAISCPIDCEEVPDPEPDPEEPDTSSCYTFLAREAKWRTVEDYIVDTTNLDGLDDSFVRSNLAMDIQKWEGYAGTEILGDEVLGVVNRDTIGQLNDKNEVMFANIGSPGAIGVTIIWGIFGGPPFNRELVEWDMVFDDVDFNWSSEGALDKIDFENIATHELGHAVGLGDLYTSECSEQTMYGYSTEGETKKRTLESGDIVGIQKLYS